MALYRRRFGCCEANAVLFEASWYLFYPTLFFINIFARLLRPTTKEQERRAEEDPCYQYLCIVFFAFPFLIAGLLVTLPLALLAAFVWFPLQFCRKPYIYIENGYADSSVDTWAPGSAPRVFSVATANVCLLPEFATRSNNLDAPGNRAGPIVDRLVRDGNLDEVIVRVNGSETPSLLAKDDAQSGDAVTVTSDARTLLATDDKLSQRSLYSQLYKIKPMENPVVSLKDDRLEPGEIRSKEYDSNMCLTSVNHSVSALDNASCDENRTENGSVNEESYGGRKMKTSIVGLDETSSIASSVITSTTAALPNPVAFSLGPTAGGGSVGDGESVSIDTVDAQSVKNLPNHSAVPKIMMSSAPPGYKIRDASSISENASNVDSIENGVAGVDVVTHGKILRRFDAFSHDVDLYFSKNLDFLCLCEVFDRGAAKIIIQKLRKHFNYILYDIAERPCFLPCNSGLLFASRYPILDAEFHKYGAHEGSDSMACKGILLVKVLIARLQDGTEVVGFISQTHLQARISANSGKFQKRQLDLAVEDIKKFHDRESDSGAKQVVCLDILSGDLNFDSESTSDEQKWSHELFQSLYIDPCRKASGEDKPWTVGTELIQSRLYDEEVATPEALRETLKDDARRPDYVASSERGGVDNGNGKRRIDYICFGRVLDSRFVPDLEHFSFIAALASLTDHVPIGMSFNILFPTMEEDRKREILRPDAVKRTEDATTTTEEGEKSQGSLAEDS